MGSFWTTGAFCLCLALGPAMAQSQFSGLIAGEVFDPPAGSVRMLFGYPGAARITGSLYAGLADAAVSPDGQAGVALQGSRILGLRSLNAAPVATVDFASTAAQLRAAWSGDSTTAAVWLANGDNSASVQFWTVRQAPAAPLQTTFSYASVQSFVLLPDGTAMLVCIKDGDNSGIYQLGSDGSMQWLVQSADPAALALDAAGKTFFFFDRSTASILQQALGSTGQAQPVVSSGLDGLATPCGLALLKSGQLALADTASATLWLFAPDTGRLANQIQLDDVPDGLAPLAGGDWLVLSHRREPAQSLLLLDSHSGSVYFVPADSQ